MPDPDRQHLLPVLVAQDDDRHVGDRIDHQPLDGHFDLHGAYNLGAAGAAVNSSTAPAPHAVRARALDAHRHRPADPRRRPRQVHDHVRARPPRQLRVAPPARRVDQHLDRPRPPARSLQRRLDRRAAAPAAPRSAASSRPPARRRAAACSASVFGRGEYLNENMLWYRTAAVSDSVSSKSASVSPGNPTIISVDSATSGSGSRIRATRSR